MRPPLLLKALTEPPARPPGCPQSHLHQAGITWHSVQYLFGCCQLPVPGFGSPVMKLTTSDTSGRDPTAPAVPDACQLGLDFRPFLSSLVATLQVAG